MIFKTPVLDDAEQEVLEQIRELWRTLRYRLIDRPLPWQGWLRRSHFALALRGSNSIEGYVVSPDDAMAAAEGDEPFDTDPRSANWLAVSHYRDAMTYVLRLSDDPEFAYSGQLIRALHYMMLRHDPQRAGAWRTSAIFVRDDRGPDPRVVYEGPPAEEVRKRMGELVGWLRRKDSTSPMIKAAMAQLNLVMIHAFVDGNGRMGRCLQTLVLARDGVLDHTFCSVEEQLGRDTDGYYKVCAEVGGSSWQPERDARPWIRFMLSAHYQQARRILRRDAEMANVFSELEEVLRPYAFKDRALTSLVNSAFGYKIKNSSYRTESGAEISQEIASRDLRMLAELGLIEPRGKTHGRYYVPTARLREVRERSRIVEVSIDPFSSERKA
jgi:Fic family protein